MSEIICRKCGHATNTALSNWVNSNDGKADSCYARIAEGRWEKGCGYDSGDNHIKHYIKDLVRKDIASLRREADKILFTEKEN